MNFETAAAGSKRLQLAWDPEYFLLRGNPTIFAPISIGFAPIDGKRNPFYAIAANFKEEWVPEGHFVRQKVLSKLEAEEDFPRVTPVQFRSQLAKYIKGQGDVTELELIHVESSQGRDFLALEDFLDMDPLVFFEEYAGVKLIITNIADLQMEICLVQPPENDDVHHALSDAYWHADFYNALMAYKRDVEMGVRFPIPPIEFSALR